MLKCVAITPFGIESVAKREMMELGFEITQVSDGRVYFTTDASGVIQANLYLRTVERIFLIVKTQEVHSFDNLFDWVASLSYRNLVDPEGQFIINAQSKNSDLYSLRDIQKITKKALIEALKKDFNRTTFTESGKRYDFLVYIQNNIAELLLDTSGEALHKRGYRERTTAAPIKETLAAAMVLLSFYDASRTLIDPFCGSGTIPIEAAMIAKNIAPGLNRNFAFEYIPLFQGPMYKQEKRKALEAIDQDVSLSIEASDVDMVAVEIAKENAYNAGVDDMITFKTADFRYLMWDTPYSVVVTNPPYGKRIGEDKSLDPLYNDLGKVVKQYNSHSFYILTPFNGFEKKVGKKASKTRVLFNGRIKTRFYQYFGPKPPIK